MVACELPVNEQHTLAANQIGVIENGLGFRRALAEHIAESAIFANRNSLQLGLKWLSVRAFFSLRNDHR